MTVKTGRLTLDCRVVDVYKEGPRQPTLDSYSAKVVLTIDLLHRRLGHSGNDALQKLLRGNLVRGADKVKIGKLQPCDFCKLGKLVQKPHPAVGFHGKGTEPLDLVIVDLAGPNRPLTLGGKRYDMVIVDTYSQRSFVILLAKKSEVAAELMKWISLVETLTGKKLKRLRSDNGGEFLSEKIQDWMKLRGSQHQTIDTYSPPSNGIAERMNRTVQDKARTMMLESKLPCSPWGF